MAKYRTGADDPDAKPPCCHGSPDEAERGPTGETGWGLTDGQDADFRMDRRNFMKTTTAIAVGTGLGAGAGGRAWAVPDDLPTDQHMHWGHQDVIFLGIYFEDTSAPGPIEDYEAAMFDPNSSLGYDEYTLDEYFEIVSDGRFSIGPGPAGFVGWYQASQPSDDFHLGDAVREALDAAIADGFDITAYDQENATQIVALTYLGGGGGGVAWVGNTIERQGVLIDGFCQAPARDSAAAQDINYSAHEYLHLHGLTDLYQEPGVGEMGIMGTGPLTNMVPWSTVNVDLDRTPEPTGWDETTAIRPTDQAGILPPQSVVNQFYTVVGEPNPTSRDPDFHKHYYLAYSDGTGLDSNYAPDQVGLLVFHHYQMMGLDWGAENLQFDTPPADGSTFQATNSDLDASLIETDVVLENVSTDYGSLLFNDPPHRAVPAGNVSAYAVDVDTTRPDWLPDLSFRESQSYGDVIYTDDVLDARASWADAGDDVTLRLIDPSGSEHAVSAASETSFAVVRSDPLTGEPSFDGGWKLLEETTGSGTVEYYRATNYPTYELATTSSIDAASLEGDEITATVLLSFASGDPYTYGNFGSPSAEQFEVEVDGELVDESDVSVTEEDQSTYDLTVEVGSVAGGEHTVSVTFVDRKAGVTHRTTADSTTISGSGSSCASDEITIGDDNYCAADLNGDGLYRDVDGNGSLGTNDVVTFFEHVEDPGVQANSQYFDFSGTGSVGTNDVVALFEQV